MAEPWKRYKPWEKYREGVAREVESWGDGDGSVSEMEREMRECILKWAKKTHREEGGGRGMRRCGMKRPGRK